MFFDNYKIDTDENNWIVQQLTKRKNGDEWWKPVAYYGIGQLDLALQNVLMRRIHASHKDELRFMLKTLAETKKEIMDAITKLKVEAVMNWSDNNA